MIPLNHRLPQPLTKQAHNSFLFMLHLHKFQIPFVLSHRQILLSFENLRAMQVSRFLMFTNRMTLIVHVNEQMDAKNYLTY